MKLNKLSAVAAAVGAMLSFSAHAVLTPTSITFDPTGTAGAAGNIANVAVFDWAPGSALAVNVNTAGGLQQGATFTTYFQANLSILQDAGGNLLFGNGTGSKFFTAVAGFGEKITSCTGTPCSNAVFGFDAANATNFFRIYAVSASAINLTGAGFTSLAPILSGHVIADGFGSNFNVTGPATPASAPLLDGNSNGDQWGGTKTLAGTGASSIRIEIDGVDANYFPDLLLNSILSLSVFTTQQVLPYIAPDPSRCMATLAGDCLEASNVGGFNGAPVGSGGDVDVLFQTDANQSFLVDRVPEPGSLALVGLGLLGLVGAGRRAKKA